LVVYGYFRVIVKSRMCVGI